MSIQPDMIPAVSVVIPLYNKADQIDRAIHSVLGQVIRDFELIVVDDGSTDSGAEIVAACRDPRIRLVSQANAGVSAARNRGIALARAGLIAFLDADDEWHPEFLKTILELTRKFPHCAVFGTNYYIANPRRETRRAVLRGLLSDFEEGVIQNYFVVAAKSDPLLFASAVAVRSAAIRAIGGFPTGVAVGEDLLTWVRLALNYQIAYFAAPLATFWEPETISSRPGRVPEVPDRVGAELAQLLSRRGSVEAGFADYVAHWHRMRGVIYLLLADSAGARSEFRKAMQIAGLRAKLLVLLLISMMPGQGARIGYELIKRMLDCRISRN